MKQAAKAQSQKLKSSWYLPFVLNVISELQEAGDRYPTNIVDYILNNLSDILEVPTTRSLALNVRRALNDACESKLLTYRNGRYTVNPSASKLLRKVFSRTTQPTKRPPRRRSQNDEVASQSSTTDSGSASHLSVSAAKCAGCSRKMTCSGTCFDEPAGRGRREHRQNSIRNSGSVSDAADPMVKYCRKPASTGCSRQMTRSGARFGGPRKRRKRERSQNSTCSSGSLSDLSDPAAKHGRKVTCARCRLLMSCSGTCFGEPGERGRTGHSGLAERKEEERSRRGSSRSGCVIENSENHLLRTDNDNINIEEQRECLEQAPVNPESDEESRIECGENDCLCNKQKQEPGIGDDDDHTT